MHQCNQISTEGSIDRLAGRGDGVKMDDFFEDVLTLCDGVISQKKDEWESMSQRQKIAWINEFARENAHPVRYEVDG